MYWLEYMWTPEGSDDEEEGEETESPMPYIEARRGEARRGETHRPLAWHPLLTGLLTLVALAFAQALRMAKNQKDAKVQVEHWETTATHVSQVNTTAAEDRRWDPGY